MTSNVNVKELPSSWMETSFGEIAEYVTSGSRDWSKYYSDKGALFIRTQDINTNRLRLDDIARVELPAKVEGKRTRVYNGDILITITGANVGKVALVESDIEEAYVSQSVALVRLKDKRLGKFLHYQLTTKFNGDKTYLESMAYGLGRPVLNLDNIRNVPVRLAPLDQQKRIVAEIEKQFSRLDEAVANLKRVKANLKRYKAAVLKAAVEGRLVETEAELARRAAQGSANVAGGTTPGMEEVEQRREQLPRMPGATEGRDYETGAQLLQRILETRRSQWKGKGKYKEPSAPDTTDLPELPEGWVWASVEQIADVGTGATPLRSKREYYDDGKIPWVTSGALNEEFVSAADEYITDFAVRATNAKVFPAHTLLVAMYGEGKTRGKVSELLIEAATNQACAAIVMEGLSAKVRDYVKLYFLKNYEDIRRLSSGGVQPNLNLSHIKATVLPLAPLAEQHRVIAEVDRRLSLTREVEAQVDANLKRAERLRQSILVRAFSGRLSAEGVEYRSIEAKELAMAAERLTTYSVVKQQGS